MQFILFVITLLPVSRQSPLPLQLFKHICERNVLTLSVLFATNTGLRLRTVSATLLTFVTCASIQPVSFPC
jgi:hypothetical protein